MARELRHVKVGEEFTCSHYNIVIDELNRLRRMRGAGLVDVDGMDGTSPPTIVGHAGGDALVPAQLTGTLATGTLAAPSSATMTLLGLAGTGAALTASGGTTGLTVWNTFALTTSLASGKQIWVTSYAGRYYLIQPEC